MKYRCRRCNRILTYEQLAVSDDGFTCCPVCENLGIETIKEEKDMALLYNTADVFVAPSLADNLPSTLIESMLCGTPVVSFKVGGIPDIVSHMNDGYLAQYRDVQDLAYGIDWVLKNYNTLSVNSIKNMHLKFSSKEIITAHNKLIINHGK